MTTNEVIALADKGGIAAPDMDLQAILVHSIVPELEDATKAAWWRRKSTTVALVAGTLRYGLPLDLRSIVHLRLTADAQDLPYIGEDPVKVLAAETAARDTPAGYFVEVGGPGSEPYGLALSCPPAQDAAAYMVYRRAILTPEDGSGFDMGARMPRELHWALVEGLRREIYLERSGKDDTRFIAAAANFEGWKARAQNFLEAGAAGGYVKSIF